MANKRHVILLSERADDTAFFKELCIQHSFSITTAVDIKDLPKFFLENPGAILVWDADNPKAMTDTKHPYSINTVRFVLSKMIGAAYVFALTDKLLSEYPINTDSDFLINYPLHNLIRSTSPVAKEVYGRLMLQIFNKTPENIKEYFEANSKSNPITIKESDQRLAAVEAIQNFLSKGGLDGRLAARVATAADELIMNAIFDAPVDASGNPSRHNMPRTSKISLDYRGQVEIEAFTGKYFSGIRVSDHYGSLSKQEVAKYLKQNFKDKDYKASKYKQGAGLGLYTLIQSGLSLLLWSISKNRTDALVFFPNAKTYKEFKNEFQFVVCLSDTDFKDR
jgi:hypothetical protein